MENIQIRQARLDELPALLAFEQNLIANERPLDDTFVAEEFHYYDLEKMIRSDDAEVVVAVMGDRLVASGNARILEGKPYNRFKRYAFLGFMYTEPDMRGRGINKLIIDGLVEWARGKGLDEVRLQVYSDNTPAIAAYEKVGFKKMLTEMRLATGI
ncbi:GNAT family N-acetyltransferase [Dyadobacter sp. CY261]|uniref:GNAT family N-acetyltransferase n=1 Tax=Dyadobacter sp. CY261 TaxID=2907203 RepID=UPI001F345A5B|nr:GNAT family N-acetyltransferase [Dyadobacter sp. CY261]MCF0071256.1 GNAT family N-acetyltransferase [Dyadobacter sp. CY261]